jgi:hypothetical protein
MGSPVLGEYARGGDPSVEADAILVCLALSGVHRLDE